MLALFMCAMQELSFARVGLPSVLITAWKDTEHSRQGADKKLFPQSSPALQHPHLKEAQSSAFEITTVSYLGRGVKSSI